MELNNIKYVTCIFLVPFYDNDIASLLDTLDSINYHIQSDKVIIAVDDCVNKHNSRKVEENDVENLLIYRSPVFSGWPRNGYGSLFCKLYQGIEYALKQYRFDYLIKLDTDALLTGNELVEHLERYFNQHSSEIGQIGSYRVKADGSKRTKWRWTLYLLFLVYLKKQLSRESVIWSRCLPAARENGYKLGESMLGGAYIYKYDCIKKIIELYPYSKIDGDKLFDTMIGEDVLFSLLTFASGYKIGDFARPGDPMAIAHKNLPLPREDIIQLRKQIIHSVKEGLSGESETELRAYFKKFRS